ncbi:MAG: hypothetical protein NVSMB2_01810 [Chloroflexota bacterium]
MPHVRWLPIAIVVLVAASLRLAIVVLVPNAQYSDSVWYDAAAANLAQHGFYGVDRPSAWFPPGYPFFLAVIYAVAGHVQFVGKLANVVVGMALVILTWALGRRLVNESVGLLGAALVALWPNLIFSTGILSSDLIDATGFAVVVWLALRPPAAERGWRWTQAGVLGLGIGWLALVRPVSLILLASIALAWWIDARSLVRAAARLAPVVVLTGLVIGAWTVRNYRDFGQVITIATNGGYNFWQTNHRYADGNDTFWSVVPMDDPEYATMWSGDEFTKNREGYRYAFTYLEHHPLHLLTMLPTKLFWLYHTDTSGLYEGILFAPMDGPSPTADWFAIHDHLAESLTFRYYEVLMVLAAVGVAIGLLSRPRPRWLWPLVALPLLLTFFHLFFHAKDRFHIPLAVSIALFAAYTLEEVARYVRRWILHARPPQRTIRVVGG